MGIEIVIFLFVSMCLLFYFLSKKKRGYFTEIISVWWFKLALSVLFLYGIHLLGLLFSVVVYINIFTIACVTLLGFPGILVVIATSVINSFETFI